MSGSGHAFVRSAAFRRDQRPEVRPERSTDGFCLWRPENHLCVPSAVPGDPGGLRSQLRGSHLSCPGQQGKSWFPEPGEHRGLKITVLFCALRR